MSITKFSIENFKGFKTKQNFELGRITLLLGANSSGKSSAIGALFCAIQSKGFPFFLDLNNSWVQFGSYENVVNNHNLKKEFEIQIGVNNLWISSIRAKWKIDKKTKLIILSKLSVTGPKLTLSAEQIEREIIITGQILIQYSVDKDFISEEFRQAIVKHPGYKKPSHEIQNDLLNNIVGEPEQIYITQRDEPLLAFELNARVGLLSPINLLNSLSPELQDAIKILTSVTRDYCENASYIGPFRLSPARDYTGNSRTAEKISADGAGYANQILSWQENDEKKVLILSKIMKDLELFHEVKAIRGGTERYQIQAKVHPWSSFENIMDVGFGVSQFLPITVADIQLSNDGTLILAEPEIHLHPSVQSKLGDYLANSLRNSAKSYIIETHSEYLLNRLRLNIVNGRIREEEVKIYFLEVVKGDTKVHRMVFNKKGQIENVPSSYFKTYRDDIFEIMEKATTE